MVRDFVPRDVPVGDESVVGVIERGEVGHDGLAAIRIFSLCEKLVDGVDGVGLYGIVCGEYDEHGDIGLRFEMR